MNSGKYTLIDLDRQLFNESMMGFYSPELQFHCRHAVGVDKNIFRPGSEKFFNLFTEVRRLHKEGLYMISDAEKFYILEADIGQFAIHEGEEVPIDFPMLEESTMIEAEYKGKKVDLNDPKRGGGKGKAYVYVNSGKKTKDGKVKAKKVSFGSEMPDAMGDSDKAKKRRKSFGDRHNCADKDDKTKAGYWSCRATKLFGRNIAGWW